MVGGFVFTLLLSCVAYAAVAQAGVPNTFIAGSTAKSGEVNHNFDFVNYGNIVVKANGVEIGSLLGIDPYLTFYTIMSPKGYVFSVRPVNTSPSVSNTSISMFGTYFTSTDCSGTPYLPADVVTGIVFPAVDDQIYYIPKNARAIELTANSYNIPYGSSCTASPNYIYNFYPLTINDPSVTGVSNTTLARPITIERR